MCLANRARRSLRKTASPPPQRPATPLVAHRAGNLMKKPRRSGAKSVMRAAKKPGGNFGPHRDNATETVALHRRYAQSHIQTMLRPPPERHPHPPRCLPGCRHLAARIRPSRDQHTSAPTSHLGAFFSTRNATRCNTRPAAAALRWCCACCGQPNICSSPPQQQNRAHRAGHTGEVLHRCTRMAPAAGSNPVTPGGAISCSPTAGGRRSSSRSSVMQ